MWRETNHYGMIVIAPLVKRHKYPRIFRKERVDRPTREPVRQDPEAHWMEYGWWTGATLSKTVMIHHLNNLIRERKLTIHEPEAWEEMRTFMLDADGGMNAESGKHDDRVMGLAIAATYLCIHPKARRKPKPLREPPKLAGDGEAVLIDVAQLHERARWKRAERKSAGGKEHFN